MLLIILTSVVELEFVEQINYLDEVTDIRLKLSLRADYLSEKINIKYVIFPEKKSKNLIVTTKL